MGRRGYHTFYHSLTLEFEDSIRAFAGEDLLKAKYYPEDCNFLLEFEPTVVHYRVVQSAA